MKRSFAHVHFDVIKSRECGETVSLYNIRTFTRDIPDRETHFKLAHILLFYVDVPLTV